MNILAQAAVESDTKGWQPRDEHRDSSVAERPEYDPRLAARAGRTRGRPGAPHPEGDRPNVRPAREKLTGDGEEPRADDRYRRPRSVLSLRGPGTAAER